MAAAQTGVVGNAAITTQTGGTVNGAMTAPTGVAANTPPLTLPSWEPEGYPKLAHLLGRLPEAVVLRRFGPLHAMTLLSLQAELATLETDLWETCHDDQTAAGDPAREEYWKSFLKIHSKQSPGDQQRAQKLKTIQDTLKEYYDMILLFSRISELKHPRRDQTRFLQQWLRGREEGKNFLRFPERFIWDNKHEWDLLVAVPSRTWLHPKFTELFHWMGKEATRCVWWCQGQQLPEKHKKNPERYDVEMAKLGRVSDSDSSWWKWFCTAFCKIVVFSIASMVPVVAVLALYHINRTSIRIYAALGMTGGTGLFLWLFTSANVKEIFGATAAFAAIIVVFIGTADNSSGGKVQP